MGVTNPPWFRRGDVVAARRALKVSEAELFKRAKREASGAAVWAQWPAGVLEANDALGRLPKGSAVLIVDPAAAIAASFEVTNA